MASSCRPRSLGRGRRPVRRPDELAVPPIAFLTVLSFDLAGEQFHIAASPGLRLELKTSAANAHPALSPDPAFPWLERRCASSILQRTAPMEMVGVGPVVRAAPTPGPRRRATPPDLRRRQRPLPWW